MALVSVVATIIGIAISLAIDWFPEQASTASDDIDLLYDVLLIASVPVFVLVMSVAIYSVLAFRAKPGDLSDGEPIHGNTRLEVIWVTIPFIMVSALAVYGWIVLEDIEAKKPNTLVVDVTGQQFAWSFNYPGERVRSNELVLPKDRPVEFRIKTKDVLHDFWVPEFRLKSDAVPGLDHQDPPDPQPHRRVRRGVRGALRHRPLHDAPVRARGPGASAYRTWVGERRQRAGDGGAAAAGGDTAAAGKQLFTDTGCDACHTLADAGSANPTVGPKLDELASAAATRGKSEGQSPEEYVRTAITRPDAYVVKGFQKGLMPKTYGNDLSAAEIDTLVEYLLGVAGGGDAK